MGSGEGGLTRRWSGRNRLVQEGRSKEAEGRREESFYSKLLNLFLTGGLFLPRCTGYQCDRTSISHSEPSKLAYRGFAQSVEADNPSSRE
jgi:hypothetical protein